MSAFAQLPTPTIPTRMGPDESCGIQRSLVLQAARAYAVQVVRSRTTVNTLLLQIVCSRSSPKEVGL